MLRGKPPETEKRGPYRQDRRADIDALMVKRRRLGVPLNTLAEAAGLSRNTLMRIKATGLAFDRQVTALARALRAFERDRRQAATAFGGEE